MRQDGDTVAELLRSFLSDYGYSAAKVNKKAGIVHIWGAVRRFSQDCFAGLAHSGLHLQNETRILHILIHEK